MDPNSERYGGGCRGGDRRRAPDGGRGGAERDAEPELADAAGVCGVHGQDGGAAGGGTDGERSRGGSAERAGGG